MSSFWYFRKLKIIIDLNIQKSSIPLGKYEISVVHNKMNSQRHITNRLSPPRNEHTSFKFDKERNVYWRWKKAFIEIGCITIIILEDWQASLERRVEI